MTSSRDLTTDLRALPHPAPPPDLTGVVLARIAQLEEEKAASTGAEMPMATAQRPDWVIWFSLGGLIAGLVIAVLSYPVSSEVATVGRGGAMTGLAGVSSAPQATVTLLSGFAIYVASLFLPVRQRR